MLRNINNDLLLCMHTHTHTLHQHTGSDTIALVPTRGAVDDDPVHSAYTIAPEW